MSTYETLLTPGTCAASDDGKIPSPEGERNRGRWKGGLSKSSSKRLGASGGGPKVVKVVPGKAEKTKRPAASNVNVVKRAIHKISKKTRRSSSTPFKPPPSAVGDTAPPKIEDLGIDPRLLEKWMARKELKKQGAVAGEKPVTSRRTATLVVVGLSSGSLAWIKDRIRNLCQANGVLLAAFIVAAAVAIACALVVGRCSVRDE